jgi:MFS family permease
LVVVAVAAVFTLARFSEAFLILRAQSIGLPLVLIQIVLVIMSLAYSLSAYPIGVLSDRVNRLTLLAVGLLLLLLADLVLAFAADIVWVGIGVVLWGLHMGFTQGLLATLIAETAPAELRGTAFGMFNLITGIALLAASVVAGALWDLAGPEGTFLAGAAFTTSTSTIDYGVTGQCGTTTTATRTIIIEPAGNPIVSNAIATSTATTTSSN